MAGTGLDSEDRERENVRVAPAIKALGTLYNQGAGDAYLGYL